MNNPNADSDKIARKYMDSLIIEGRVLGAEKPSSKVTFLGTEFSTPIMAGALSHLKPARPGRWPASAWATTRPWASAWTPGCSGDPLLNFDPPQKAS